MVALDRTETPTREDMLITEGENRAIDLDVLDMGTWGAQSVQSRQHGVIYLLTRVQVGKPETQTLIIQFHFDSQMFRSLGSWVPSPAGLSRTFGACSVGRGDNDDEQWILRNKRRIYLINKRFESSLTAGEAVELEQLQADMARYLDAVAPLPIHTLERFEEYARQIADVSNQPEKQ
jgi:hypothetical protein